MIQLIGGWLQVLILIIVMVVMAGCSLVGVKVPSNISGVCKMSSQCLREDSDISISYKITKENDEYEIVGTAVLHGYYVYINASFTLFLIKDNTIVDEIPIISGSDSSSTIPFGRKFKGKDFDATLISCRLGGAG